MSLRQKTIIILSLIFASLILIIYGASQKYLEMSFVKLENNYTSKNVDQAVSALHDNVDSLDTVISDWSNWDDTYKFINDRNTDYIKSNLGDSLFNQLKINIMIFVNLSGQIVFSREFTAGSSKSVVLTPEEIKSVLGDGVLKYGKGDKIEKKGVIITPKGPAIITLRPILHSDEQGPSRGILVMGRYLDANQIKLL